MTVGSGRLFCELCGSVCRDTCWQRTFLDSLGSSLTDLTGCANNWRQRAISASRSLWVLTTLERRIDGSVCGSWVTPQAVEASGGQYCYTNGDHSRPTPTLTGQVKGWPAPNAQDGERGAESAATKDARGSGGVNLREACNWQTPTSADGGSTSRGGDRKGELLLGGQVRQSWPTPTVAEAGKISCRPNHGQVGLSNHPDVHGYSVDRPKLNKSRAGQPDLARHSTNGKPRGSLNARWVLQLQGLPDGWLDIGTDALSRLSGIVKSLSASN